VPNCVLIADDSPAIRHAVRRLFEEAGWEVCGEAENGQEALAMAQALKPHIIVLDLSMPIMDGLTAARILKREMPDVHLILFTLYSDFVRPEEARSAGISAVVAKAQAPVTLLSTAQSLLNSRAIA
jgi:DNA-binding NarL/FixJ family response regulator